jgi:hypothetical protein
MRWHAAAVALALCGILPRALLAASSPPAAAVNAYGSGQSYSRLLQDTEMPGICGIVLERERCNADFRSVHAWRGSDPSDADTAAWLADGDLASHKDNWNGAYVTEQGWTEDSTFAWWYTAGVISIAIAEPRNDATAKNLAHYIGELNNHSNATPPGFAGLILANGTPFEQAQGLQRALDAAIPVRRYPPVSLEAGPAGTARLGVYLATLLELFESPLGLSRPESRAFAATVLAELERRHHEYADGLSVASLQAAVHAQIPLDPETLDATLLKPLSANMMNAKWPQSQRAAFAIGSVAAQLAYNAAVLKDPASDASFRTVLAQLPRWPGMPAQLRADLTALQNLPPAGSGGSWKAINAAATRATLDVMGAAAQ